jgi:hypothetical protein
MSNEERAINNPRGIVLIENWSLKVGISLRFGIWTLGFPTEISNPNTLTLGIAGVIYVSLYRGRRSGKKIVCGFRRCDGSRLAEIHFALAM